MPLDQGSTQVISALSGNAVLIWVRDDGSEMRFPILAPVTTIGREPSNMIPLNDSTVSRFHAKLVYQNGQYVLMDLGSANKTFVNGKEIKEAVLHSGCDIKIAGLRLKFQETRPAAPAHAPAPVRPPVPPPRAGVAAPARSPYPASAAPAAPVKRRPKPLFILGGAFGVLLILVIVVSLMTKSSKPPAPAAQGATPAASAPTSSAPVTPSPAPATSPAATSTSPATSPLTAPTTAATQPATGPSPATSALTLPTPPPSGPPSISHMLDDAAALESSGKLRDARIKYEAVLKLDPTNSRARSHVESLRATIKDAVNLHFTNAKQAYDFLRFDEAIDEWNLVLSLADPSDPMYIESQRGIQQAQARLRR